MEYFVDTVICSDVKCGFLLVMVLMEQVEELLTPVRYYLRDTGDPSYTVSVVSLIKNSLQLSCRPGNL